MKPILSIKPIVRSQKNIIYNNNKYQIDFDLLKRNSNYFYSNRKYYKNVEDIELQLEPIEITDKIFQIFISCCQNQSFQLDDINVFPLHQLSIRYEVPELISLTNQYISKNSKTLIIQAILFKLQLQNHIDQANQETSEIKSTREEEKIISSQILEYINNDQLLLLPVHVLYNIFNDPNFNFKEMSKSNQNKVVDFLFKCLDKYKREASVLFINLDLENERTDLLKRLLNQYSDVFDFNMINSRLLVQTTSELLSELNKLKLYYSNQVTEMNKSLKIQNDVLKLQIQNQQKLFETFQNDTNEQLKKTINDFKQEIYAFIKQQNIDLTNKQQNALQDKQKVLQDKQNSLQYQQNTLQSKQNTFQNKQSEFAAQQEQFQSKVNELEAKINRMEESFSQQEKSIKNNGELICSNKAEINSDINIMKAELESLLEAKLSDQNKRYNEIKQALNQLRNKINSNSGNNHENVQKEIPKIRSINLLAQQNPYKKPYKSFLSSSSSDEDIDIAKYKYDGDDNKFANRKLLSQHSNEINEPSSARSYIESKENNNSYLYGIPSHRKNSYLDFNENIQVEIENVDDYMFGSDGYLMNKSRHKQSLNQQEPIKSKKSLNTVRRSNYPEGDGKQQVKTRKHQKNMNNQ